jgi:hypothetical protein
MVTSAYCHPEVSVVLTEVPRKRKRANASTVA